MDWEAIERQIVQDDQDKWDKTISSLQLQLFNTGQLAMDQGNHDIFYYTLSDLAVRQMCQRLEIPVVYYRRLPGEMKALMANYDLDRLKDSQYLLRGKLNWIRAFLSKEYVAYNNSQITETVKSLLGKSLERLAISVKNFVLEETNMFLKLVSEEIVDQEAGLKAGIIIGNSEVGMGGVSVEPFVFRKPCTNDLIVAQERSFRHAHIHFTSNEFTRRTAEAINNGFQVANSVLEAFIRSHADKVPDPTETIRKIAESRKLSQKFTDEVISGYMSEPEPTRFGVINAFTRAAQSLAPLQQIEMERFAGKLLEAPLH